MKKYLLKIAFVFALCCAFVAASSTVSAQCPMCRMSAESNLKDGGKAGRGLNTGILYMLAMPYLLVGCIGFWWWKNRRKEMEDHADPFLPPVDKKNINYN